MDLMNKPQYPALASNVDFAALEREVLEYWKKEGVFQASVENRPREKEGKTNAYVFYDGPPFANGLPHYGHLLTGYVKDLVARYQTMRGKRVERRFGWDCHGLPAEMQAEKELGISGRQKIMEYGIGKFNEYCRTSVMRYTQEWQQYVDRQGRWVDFENDYKTMDKDYMESVLWAFKQLYEKGYIYEAYRVLPYSWGAETPLSNFETRLDNATRERVDKAVTVAFELNERPEGAPEAEKYFVLAWTTTPWTLPSNLALAVHRGMVYSCVIQESLAGVHEHRSPLAGEPTSAPARVGGGKSVFATEKAQAMRKEPTEAEKALWNKLRKEELGYKFRRQQPIGKYVVDFYQPETRLVIEADGGQHLDNSKDQERTAWLESQGLHVLRFWNNEVLENIEGVMAKVTETLAALSPLQNRDAVLAPPQGGSKVCFILQLGAVEKYQKEFGAESISDFQDLLNADKESYEQIIASAIRDIKNGHIFKGEKLIDLTYKPLFPYFADHPNAFRILDGSEFIEEGSGTGIVHMAPGFGEVDQKCCESDERPIKLVVPVDGAGKYTDEIFDIPFPASASPHPNPLPEGEGIRGEAQPLAGEREKPSPSGRGETLVRVSGEGILLATERLYLRPFTEADYPLYQSLQSDPKVAATTSDGLLPEEKIRAEFERFLADQARQGFTNWALFRTEDNAFIGRAGFDARDYLQFNESSQPAVELRYALLSEFWGQGYATEISIALLDWATLNLPERLFIACCNPTYPDAVKLLKKLGFTSHHNVTYKNQQVLHHTQTVKEWCAHRNSLDCRVAGAPRNDVIASAAKQSMRTLRLRGLNVIADVRKDEGEPYTDAQLQKYGLANLRITQWLKERGQLIKQDDYAHNYPHCWRTDTPLIYRAMPSWYVKVTEFKHRAVELNRKINWVPGHVRDGAMGHMLETAPDWSISRNRFWGCPIPIWKSDNPNNKQLYVFGSIAELQDFFKCDVKDLHRPYIDELTAPDPTDSNYTLRRVEDVLDCWFESGSMPYAQLHYPFENREKFEANFPADFITEYIAQTRGWFNTLIMLSTAIFDREPFENVICHGVVIDEETGLKYSKRLKNYKDPMEVIEQFGADALRWLMVASPVMRGQDLGVDPDGKFIRDVVRLYIKPIWNAYHFFCLYANADKVKAEFATLSDNAMDRYILAKCREMLKTVRDALDAYDTPTACSAIAQFSEVLNNWYIRRNRARFWKGEVDADKMSAYHTLYTVLHCVARAAAPLLPFTMEAMFAGLVGQPLPLGEVETPRVSGEGFPHTDSSPHPTLSQRQRALRSVHLQNFPQELEAADLRADGVLHDMDRVRDICNAAHGIRNAENIRTRQPLATLTVYQPRLKANHDYYRSLIADEVNVKEVVFSEELEAVASFKLKIHFPVAGKRLGAKMKDVGAAAKSGQWSRDASGVIVVGGEALEAGEYDLHLEAKDAKGSQPLSAQDGLVRLDLTLTPKLEAEGIARDVVRMIQEARKNAQFDITDRITLTIQAGAGVATAIASHQAYISEQTLANAVVLGVSQQADFTSEHELDGERVVLSLSRAVSHAA
ncbi:MAG: GNAT family N-acetyltransferase [Rickettsiales bacterium]|nr:GNAT family N-acetyltransferase [Rickettsiales bacterium]